MLLRRLASVLLIAGVGCAALGLSGCSRAPEIWEVAGGKDKVKVVVSFPPLYSFVKSVGGDRVAVISLCTTTGPHHYTHNAEDALKLREADVFFAAGLALDDSFTDRALTSSDNPGLNEVTKLCDLIVKDVHSGRLPESYLCEGICCHDHEHEHEHGANNASAMEEEHEHEHQIDSHMWSGIPQAIVMVEKIRDRLKQVDPEGSAEYDRNAGEYIARLKKLHDEGKKMLEGKKDRRLVTFHASHSYFAESFDLIVVDTITKNPGTQPSAPEFQELVDGIARLKVGVIAVEPQYPQEGAAHVLVSELHRRGRTGVNVIELDPLETAAPSELSDSWYEERMRANLQELARALP